MRIQQDPVAAMSELQAFFTRLHGKGQAEAEAHQEQIELVDQEPAAVHAGLQCHLTVMSCRAELIAASSAKHHMVVQV